jgi:Xaa-Pro aminopeptidase
MIVAKTYADRRGALRRAVPDGAILLLGQPETPRNYAANAYPFRQDSHFLYYTGLNLPDLALLVAPDGRETLFGPPVDMDTIIWMGPRPSLEELATSAGVAGAADVVRLRDAVASQSAVCFLPPYRGDQALRLAALLGVPASEAAAQASRELMRAAARQRSIKSDEEVAEIEEALGVSARMLRAAAQAVRPGARESEIAAAMQRVSLAADRAQAFCPIVSIRGETLHNTFYGNVMQAGGLLLLDYGAESPRGYASDVTRVLPVSGRFTPQQREIHQVVLDAQLAVIAAASPRRTNRELHLLAARTIAGGLKAIGLMKGDVDQAVEQGAHALFFPHGIGHMLGLDVHDMEDLGDLVGYPEGEARSTQFGLAFLRLAKKLEAGFVITVEPGVYFIPPLIDLWAAERRHAAFIDYRAVEAYRGFGGVRIEDDLLITSDGARVLGPGIPKTADQVERLMAGG